MVSKAQKEQMLEYLVTKLSNSGSNVKPASAEIVPGFETNYLLVENDGLVLLIDKKYGGAVFEKIVRKANEQKQRVAIVFYMDKQNYFRSAANECEFKRKDRSLKEYSQDEIYRMIKLRPEKISLLEKDNRKWIQYYQPQSENFEAVVSYLFKPVHFDYSHKDPHLEFRPQNQDSRRIFIWKDGRERTGDLVLGKRSLVLPSEIT